MTIRQLLCANCGKPLSPMWRKRCEHCKVPMAEAMPIDTELVEVVHQGPVPTTFDSGLGLVILLGGWILPLITSALAGVVVGLATGDWWRFVWIVVVGTVVGWIGTLVFWTKVGSYLQRQGVGRGGEDLFTYITELSGVVIAIAVAIVAWGQ